VVLGDALQRLLRIEPPVHHRCAAEREGQHELRQPGAVEDRRSHVGHPAGAQRDAVQELCGGEHRHAVPRCAFRGTGGAAGQQHKPAGLRWCRHVGGRVRRNQRVQLRNAGVHVVFVVHPGQVAGHVGRDCLEQAGELAVVDQGAHALTFGDVGELGFGEARVHHDQSRTGLPRGEHGQHQTTVVAAQRRDRRALAVARRGPGAGQRVGLRVELGEGDRPPLVDQRDGMPILLGGVLRSADKRPVLAHGEHCLQRMVHPGQRYQPGAVHHLQASDHLARAPSGVAEQRSGSADMFGHGLITPTVGDGLRGLPSGLT